MLGRWSVERKFPRGKIGGWLTRAADTHAHMHTRMHASSEARTSEQESESGCPVKSHDNKPRCFGTRAVFSPGTHT